MSSLHGVLNCLSFFYIYICCFMVVGWGLSCKPITLILYSNFKIFVTVVTGPVGMRQITLRSCTFADPRTAPRLFGQKSRTYLLYKSRVMANFMLLCGKNQFIFQFLLGWPGSMTKSQKTKFYRQDALSYWTSGNSGKRTFFRLNTISDECCLPDGVKGRRRLNS